MNESTGQGYAEMNSEKAIARETEAGDQALAKPADPALSLRVVYRQNWIMTMGKFVMIGLSYMTILGLVTTGVAIASFVLL